MNTNNLNSQEEKNTLMTRFKKFMGIIISNKAAFLGLIIILLIVLVAFLGNFIMPYDPYTGELSNSLQSQ